MKDMIGPEGCVSIVAKEQADAAVKIDRPTTPTPAPTHCVFTTRASTPDGSFARPDEIKIDQGRARPSRLMRARAAACSSRRSRGEVDLSEHLEDAINSLRIVFAADESMRTGQVVRL